MLSRLEYLKQELEEIREDLEVAKKMGDFFAYPRLEKVYSIISKEILWLQNIEHLMPFPILWTPGEERSRGAFFYVLPLRIRLPADGGIITSSGFGMAFPAERNQLVSEEVLVDTTQRQFFGVNREIYVAWNAFMRAKSLLEVLNGKWVHKGGSFLYYVSKMKAYTIGVSIKDTHELEQVAWEDITLKAQRWAEIDCENFPALANEVERAKAEGVWEQTLHYCLWYLYHNVVPEWDLKTSIIGRSIA